MARPAAVVTTPRDANELIIKPVAILLCKTIVTSMPEVKSTYRLDIPLPIVFWRRLPSARDIPMRTIRMPHNKSAEAPSKFINICVEVITSSPF
jgi:hypothetical protein